MNITRAVASLITAVAAATSAHMMPEAMQPTGNSFSSVYNAYISAVPGVPSPTPTTARPEIRTYLAERAGDSRVFILASEIIRRESGWHPEKCNETTPHGCDAGQGLFMVIPSTELTCEEHFGTHDMRGKSLIPLKMNMLDAYDNIDCGLWLLTANGVQRGIANWDDMSWKKSQPRVWGSGPYVLSDFGF